MMFDVSGQSDLFNFEFFVEKLRNGRYKCIITEFACVDEDSAGYYPCEEVCVFGYDCESIVRQALSKFDCLCFSLEQEIDGKIRREFSYMERRRVKR